MMIVQCQACRTRFRVEESRIQGRGARMRCRRCGEAIIVMKDSAFSPGSSPPKNLFDLRSVLKQADRKPPGFPGEKPTPFPRREPETPEAEAAPPPGETAGFAAAEEAVTLRMTEETPRETVPGQAELPSFAPEPEGREPETPEAETAPTPGETAGFAAEEEAVTLRMTEETPRETAIPQEFEIPAAWEPPSPQGRPDLSDEQDRAAASFSPAAEEPMHLEEKPFELMLNDADALDFLKEEYQRAGAEGDLDISGILRAAPSPDPEPAEAPSQTAPREPAREEAMSDRLEAIQRELQEIGGGSPEPTGTPSPSPAAVSPVPPVRKAPPSLPRISARPGKLRSERPSLLLLALLFLLIAGGGAYLGFTSQGEEILRRVVPAMESLWLGRESAELRYSVGNLVGYYEPDSKAGPLFVIMGTVTNHGRKKRSGIRVRADLLGSKGEHVAGKSVYAGNVLSGDALRASSRDAIEREMANRWGDKLSNLDIAPGKSIPFMVVFFDAPEGVQNFRIEARDGE